jgi:putative chitinase
LEADGRFGQFTGDAISQFQSRVLKMAKPDGRVDPNGQTLKKLRAGIPAQMTPDKMQGIFLHAPEARITKFYSALVAKMADNAINTALRMAHFLAQLGHESGDLLYTEEIASGEAYEGRADLGNTQPGDGKRFKGRGLIQLTGRANYQAYGDARGKDYTTNNNWTLIATDPNLAVDVAGWYWNENDINQLADKDSVNEVTYAINGGYNGLDDRKRRLGIAKCFLLPG